MATGDWDAAAASFDTLSLLIDGGVSPSIEELTEALSHCYKNEDEARAAAERLANSL